MDFGVCELKRYLGSSIRKQRFSVYKKSADRNSAAARASWEMGKWKWDVFKIKRFLIDLKMLIIKVALVIGVIFLVFICHLSFLKSKATTQFSS